MKKLLYGIEYWLTMLVGIIVLGISYIYGYNNTEKILDLISKKLDN